MAAKDKVLSALNFLTGENISFYPMGVDDGAIQVLIDDYFNAPPESGSESSDDETDHSTEGETCYYLMHFIWYTHRDGSTREGNREETRTIYSK